MIYVFDLLGVVVFAISGALVGIRKDLDLFGIMVVAVITAIGGGTLRDLILDVGPVFWVANPTYVTLAAGIALPTVMISAKIEAKKRYLLWADALGLSFYGMLGVRAALAGGAPPVTAVLLAAMGAVAGGALRDVLCAQTPMVLREEVYATAVIAGATSYLAAVELGASQAAALVIGFLTCLSLRVAGIYCNLALPISLITRQPKPAQLP